MDSFELAFKIIAVLHGIAGLAFSLFVIDEDFKKFCFYKQRAPLAGDFHKYLAYLACLALMACCVAAFLLPKLAVALAWLSLVFYLSTGLVDLIAERRWPALCKGCAVTFAVRTIAVAALTATSRQWAYG